MGIEERWIYRSLRVSCTSSSRYILMLSAHNIRVEADSGRSYRVSRSAMTTVSCTEISSRRTC